MIYSLELICKSFDSRCPCRLYPIVNPVITYKGFRITSTLHLYHLDIHNEFGKDNKYMISKEDYDILNDELEKKEFEKTYFTISDIKILLRNNKLRKFHD